MPWPPWRGEQGARFCRAPDQPFDGVCGRKLAARDAGESWRWPPPRLNRPAERLPAQRVLGHQQRRRERPRALQAGLEALQQGQPARRPRPPCPRERGRAALRSVGMPGEGSCRVPRRAANMQAWCSAAEPSRLPQQQPVGASWVASASCSADWPAAGHDQHRLSTEGCDQRGQHLVGTRWISGWDRPAARAVGIRGGGGLRRQQPGDRFQTARGRLRYSTGLLYAR